MKKVFKLFIFILCLSCFTVMQVNAKECKYNIKGTSLSGTNTDGTPISYTYEVTCIPNSSTKTVSCNVNSCDWSAATTHQCTYGNVQTDIDYDEFIKGDYECADYLYGAVTISQSASSYADIPTKVNLSYIVSNSKKVNYSNYTFITGAIANRAALEKEEQENKKNENNDTHINLDIEFKEGSCNAFLGDVNDKNSPIYYLDFIFKLIKYAAIVLLLVLSVVEFTKALASSNQDALKKAIQTTVKRLIIAIIIFVLPILINFILKLLGFVTDDPTCGIGFINLLK